MRNLAIFFTALIFACYLFISYIISLQSSYEEVNLNNELDQNQKAKVTFEKFEPKRFADFFNVEYKKIEKVQSNEKKVTEVKVSPIAIYVTGGKSQALLRVTGDNINEIKPVSIGESFFHYTVNDIIAGSVIISDGNNISIEMYKSVLLEVEVSPQAGDV
ncbi:MULTISPECIES: hypothetical protein [Pseudoalteromonas]|uniref:hypothetical protein n=1 Tax=Pseudoalteromonas TaxID=53246 RepID=UPI00029A4D88|nr:MULTISPECIES: hypothetical protein [Pseudoalteromonas]AUJ68883.1 hypothetical protein PNC201_02735 [Pseudoalteromonas sp. NC201]MCF7513910.1 hypothetical protein [Pseudoalteromonas sp. L7]MCF7525951.1 hypothetical protein [Pseudoalteromonas sp. L23]MCX2766928.1 hypothetical protein [Pseudoalteromonas sp. B530]